jgi:hypothetical protein
VESRKCSKYLGSKKLVNYKSKDSPKGTWQKKTLVTDEKEQDWAGRVTQE